MVKIIKKREQNSARKRFGGLARVAVSVGVGVVRFAPAAREASLSMGVLSGDCGALIVGPLHMLSGPPGQWNTCTGFILQVRGKVAIGEAKFVGVRVIGAFRNPLFFFFFFLYERYHLGSAFSEGLRGMEKG